MISSNRDEIITRAPAEPPVVREIGGVPLLFPRDPVGGGTWIASNAEATACLFNGAFEPHERKPNYRLSRGVVPLEYFQFLDVERFVKDFNFSGIEPFSMVIYRKGSLHEIKWDEEQVHVIVHDAEAPHIWASVTLYDQKTREERRRWFEQWLATSPDFDPDAAMGFHTTALGDKINGLLINRPSGLRTVSVTSISHVEDEGAKLQYRDLVKNLHFDQKMSAEPS